MSAIDPGLHYPIDLSALPKKWEVCYLGDQIKDIQPGFASGIHNQEGNGVPHLRPMNVNRQGNIDLDVVKSVADTNGLRLRRGDVLFNNTNSPELIGKTAAIGGDENWAFSNHMTRLRPPPNIFGKFVAHQLHFLWMSGYFKHRCVKHVNQASISSRTLAQSIPLVLPSLTEQQQIVAEIDKQFTRLEVGVAALQRVQANLKRYRASVLKAACEGRLVPTEAKLARAEGRSYEPAPQLLARILTKRRNSWQGRGSYKESTLPETSSLPPLAESWTWASLDQLQSLLRNGISAKPNAKNGLPILRISAVRPLQVNLTEIRYLTAKVSDYCDYALKGGDLLFTRYNGNPDFVGVCGVVPVLTSPLVHPDKLIRCQLVSDTALSAFVAIMANVGESRSYLTKRVRTTAGQAGISGGDLKGLPIPLAPLAEQKRIVAEVERRLSVVDQLEAVVTANRQRATRLRQSILNRAFTKMQAD